MRTFVLPLLGFALSAACLASGCGGASAQSSDSAASATSQPSTSRPTSGPSGTVSAPAKGDRKGSTMTEKIEKIEKSEQEWREELSAEEFRVLRTKGTERAFTGEYWNEKKDGVYACAGCGLELYDAQHKFDSGTGWPSFYQAVDEDHIGKNVDKTLGMTRTEAVCARCGGHLGHIFNDGPRPTGMRHCINSVSLDLKPRGEAQSDAK